MKLNLPDYLNDDPQNVIYRQDDSWKFTSKWGYNYVQKVEVFWQFQFSVEFFLCTCCHLLNYSLISCILMAQICRTSATLVAIVDGSRSS